MLVIRYLLKRKVDIHITSQGNPRSVVRRDDGRSWGRSTTPIHIQATASTTSLICVAVAWEATIRIQSGRPTTGYEIPTILYSGPCDQNNGDRKENRVIGNVETPLTALLAKFDAGIDKVLCVAEVHAILDSHVLCVRIADSCESACCDIVPNL
jgi:hypothetical protein